MEEQTYTQKNARMMAGRDDLEQEDRFHDNRRAAVGVKKYGSRDSLYEIMYSEPTKTIRIKKGH